MTLVLRCEGRHSLAAIAAAGAMVVAACLSERAHAQAQITEGFVSHGALQWPEYIATELGWFKENGVNVDMVVVGAGAAQQVAAGALNIGYSGFPDFIRATNQGAPLKIVINAISAPPYAVYAKPAIKQIADLKGKTVSIGGTKDVTLRFSKQDRKDSADTYDYFVSKLHAFSADGRISEPAYKRMTDALVDWGDLKEPVPPASKFFDLSFVEAAWK
jgi:NMT1/THI5 like